MKGRILYVLTELGMGGAEVQVVELARAFQRRGWETGIVSMCHPVDLMDRLAADGIPLFSLGLERGQKTPRMFTRLIREVRRFRPDVLHTHTLPANLLGRFVRPLVGVKVLVTSAHNVNEGGAAKMALYRLTDRQADLTTNVSVKAVARYVRIGAVPSAERILYMPNGIDLDRFRPDDAVRARVRAELGFGEQDFFWLAVGRLFPQKDYPNLIEAVARAPGRQRILVAGIGDDEAALRTEIVRRGVPIELLGMRHDVPDLMRAADGYVMSSAWEGLPIVLLEAAATGLPMVVTDVGGNREIVQDGVSGLLVPPGDPDALARAMSRLVGLEPARRRQMGLQARDGVRSTFDLEAVVGRWEERYTALLERPAR